MSTLDTIVQRFEPFQKDVQRRLSRHRNSQCRTAFQSNVKMFIYKLHCLYILIILHIFTGIITTHYYDYGTFFNVLVRGLTPPPVWMGNKLTLSYQKPCRFTVFIVSPLPKFKSSMSAHSQPQSTQNQGCHLYRSPIGLILPQVMLKKKKKKENKECKGLYHIKK